MPDRAAIVIPCFNQGRFLRDAVSSALRQGDGVQVIVVDDGSTDETPEICRGFADSIRTLRQANAGLGCARNAGLRAATAEYVVFLDADDRLLPGAISLGISRLLDRPGAVLSSGDHRYIDVDGRVLQEWRRTMPASDHYQALLRGNYIGMGGAVVYRHAVLLQAGGFDETLRACEDYDLYLRLARTHELDAHGAVVAEYRRHGQNMSQNALLMLESALAVLDRHRPDASDRSAYDAWVDGRQYWIQYYSPQLTPARPSGGARR